MKVYKKVIHLLFSVFLIWQTYVVIERLILNPPSNFLNKFVDSILLNLFVTGIFTIVYSFPVYKLLPQTYYKIKNPKLLKLFGKIIKIELFKKILINTIWNKNLNKKYFFNGLKNGFSEFEIKTKQSEFGHFVGFCIVLIIMLFIGTNVDLIIAILIFFVNIFFNFYPFMLQRFHRMRINKLKNHINKKSEMIQF